jgi:hypothetical protein
LPQKSTVVRFRAVRLNREDDPMKFMIPFLIAFLPVLAQSQSAVAPGVPGVAIPKTTVDAKTEGEAQAIMETLPLAKEGLMDHEYIPVGPLMPLRALMGPGAQQ